MIKKKTSFSAKQLDELITLIANNHDVIQEGSKKNAIDFIFTNIYKDLRDTAVKMRNELD